ncbi:uncharacterized protein K02A2.6-like isoform X1 [Anopheles merus]|uniref:uncharacterized protein K02A2.6-like isoform X1 n=1 Tax=Anopheles merus TaxID=30066 RepID=UPI001BE3F67E|nr:uncharacterized protein K02A2.6-like isoform X1 [Anopheles merus]
MAQKSIQQAILQMTQILQQLAQPTPAPSNPEKTLEALATNISEFSFDPDKGITFEKWFSRYTDLFDSDAGSLDDAAKVRLLMRKLDTSSHTRYANYILPKLPKDINFTDTIATLGKIFGEQTSIFNKRYQCLQLIKSDAEDIITYGGKVNRACEDFDFKNMKIDQFKCLVLICGLKGHSYADVRARLLSRIENESADAPITLQNLIDEYQRLVNLKTDTSIIEHQSNSKPSVYAVTSKVNNRQQHFPKPDQKTPRTPCWQCGQMHYIRDCPFSKHQCQQCNRVGHKEGYCACFSKQSNAGDNTNSTPSSSQSATQNGKKPFNKNKAKKEGQQRGVFAVNKEGVVARRKYVEVHINNNSIELQLDCGSDYTIVSKDTLTLLGNPEIHATALQVKTAGKVNQVNLSP